MMTGKLTGPDAVNLIGSAAERGHKILGVDGFRTVPEGHEASLDLILDLSTQPASIRETAMAAIRFVTTHAADDVLFEVVVDDSPGG